AGGSAPGHAFRVYIDRVDRAAGGHHQPIALATAETEVGGALRKANPPDHRGVWSKDNDPVLGAGHSPAAPEIAPNIAAKSVRCPFAGVDEDSTVGEFGTVLDHIEDTDEPRSGA